MDDLLVRLRGSFEERGVEFLGHLDGESDLVEKAVKEADIVCCCVSRKSGSLSGRTPLFDGSSLKPGCHVNSVGSFTSDTREVDGEVLRRAKGRITIDDAGANSVGDFSIESWKETETQLLGEFLNFKNEGGVSKGGETGDISFFKSVGVGWLDIVAGGVVVRNANKIEGS